MLKRLVPLVVGVVLAAAVLGWLIFLRKGTLLLVPLPGRAYKVAVDGTPVTPVARGHVLEVSISQGARHVRVEDDKGGSIDHDLVIKNAAHPYVAGVDRDQCFLEFDFTDFYGSTATSTVPPLRESDKHLDGKPFQTSRETRFARSELPETKREHMPQFVLKAVPCEAYARGTVDLTALLRD